MMEIEKNTDSEWYSAEQLFDVVKCALELDKKGELRTILDSGKEIAYWYAPEVHQGRATPCSLGRNDYKTVALRYEDSHHMTDIDYQMVLDKLYELSKKQKVTQMEIFTILEAPMDKEGNVGTWTLARNKQKKPYTYTSYAGAQRMLNTLTNKAAKMADESNICAYKVQKYCPDKPVFNNGIVVDEYFALKTFDGQFLGEACIPVPSLDDAVIFPNTIEGELMAVQMAEEFNANVTFYQTREIPFYS